MIEPTAVSPVGKFNSSLAEYCLPDLTCSGAENDAFKVFANPKGYPNLFVIDAVTDDSPVRSELLDVELPFRDGVEIAFSVYARHFFGCAAHRHVS